MRLEPSLFDMNEVILVIRQVLLMRMRRRNYGPSVNIGPTSQGRTAKVQPNGESEGNCHSLLDGERYLLRLHLCWPSQTHG